MSDRIKASYVITRSKEYYTKFKPHCQRTKKKIKRNNTWQKR